METAEKSKLTLLERAEVITKAAFERHGFNPELGQVGASAKGKIADFQCNGAMAAARQARRTPNEVAREIVADLRTEIDFATIEVAGPGFINFVITDAALASRTNELVADARSGHRKTIHPDRMIIDYGGPNAAKAMHVGHLRSAVIGQCLKSLLRFQGNEVIGDIHLGDWGLQMGQLITELQRIQPGLPYFDSDAVGPFPENSPCTMEDLLSLYPQASARCKDDPAAREAARQAS